MSILRSVFVLSLGAVLAGCSIHPLPKNVTRDTTVKIVEKIKCEARAALDKISVQVLRTSAKKSVHDLAGKIENGRLKVRNILDHWNIIDKPIQNVFIAFNLSSVVFDFTFDIKETNDNTITGNFRLPLANPAGLLTVALKGGKKLERKNERKFKIGTTFEALHQEGLDSEYCDNIAAKRKHLIYPITGRIGLEEIFATFIKLNLSPSAPQIVKDLSETLTFTTTLMATATPKIALDPIADHRFRLASLEGSFGETRVDIHKVAITVGVGEKSNLEGLREALITADRIDPNVLIAVPGHAYDTRPFGVLR